MPELIQNPFADSGFNTAFMSIASPAFFMRSLGIQPDPWQAQALDDRTHQQIALLCSRQIGKSTTAAILALHTALYKPNALILLISPTQRQSTELFTRIQQFYLKLPGQPKLSQDSVSRMTLVNGSRIISLPAIEANIRGYSAPALIIVDEAARVPDEVYLALRPMLAISRGRLMILSTPFGKRGWFYNTWKDEADWLKISISADHCSRIPAKDLESERIKLGERWYNQEYMCRFEEATDAIFPDRIIEAALTDSFELPMLGRAV